MCITWPLLPLHHSLECTRWSTRLQQVPTGTDGFTELFSWIWLSLPLVLHWVTYLLPWPVSSLEKLRHTPTVCASSKLGPDNWLDDSTSRHSPGSATVTTLVGTVLPPDGRGPVMTSSPIASSLHSCVCRRVGSPPWVPPSVGSVAQGPEVSTYQQPGTSGSSLSPTTLQTGSVQQDSHDHDWHDSGGSDRPPRQDPVFVPLPSDSVTLPLGRPSKDQASPQVHPLPPEYSGQSPFTPPTRSSTWHGHSLTKSWLTYGNMGSTAHLCIRYSREHPTAHLRLAIAGSSSMEDQHFVLSLNKPVDVSLPSLST